MRKVIIGLAALVVVAVGGAGAYIWFAGGSGEPTTDVTAPPITATTQADGSGSMRSFVISPEGTVARFEVMEVLQGEDNQVVGTTSEVAGQIRFDPSDLSTAAVSEIVINARTLSTDSSSRDRAIRSPIMLNSASDEFELITFAPTSREGLPEQVEVGDTVMSSIVGDLTIKGTTMEETFEVEVTWAAEDRLEGTATTTVDRTDYGIEIPSVASVANVSEEVTLTLEFVAEAA